MIGRWGALLLAVAGAVLLAIVATTPPSPAPLATSAASFSAARAMADVRVIARAPHPTGSAADAAVRAYLAARLRGMGLRVETRTAPLDAVGAMRLATWRGAAAPAPVLTNVVATLPGRDRAAPAVLLMAHHDSVWGSPGAADDGAGVAALLETVRAIRAGGQPGGGFRRDLIVLLTDGEELGLQGAKAFFATDPRRDRIGVIVNTETRGGGGRAAMFETGARNGDWMRLFDRGVARPVATSLSVFVYQHLPNSTDYTVAKKRGVPGFNFAFIGRAGLYHSPLATPDRLDQGALQDMGRQVLGLTHELLAVPVLPAPASDRTFFDAFGLFLVSYPAWAGWIVLGLAALGYAVAGWRRPAVQEAGAAKVVGPVGPNETFDERVPTAVGRGVAVMLALLVLAPLLLFGGNLISGADGPVNYYDRLAAIPRLSVQALLLCAAAGALVRAALPAARASRQVTVGAAVPLLVLGLVAQALAPTAAFPIAWPLLLGGLALATHRLFGVAVGRVAIVAAAMLGGGYLLALGFFLMQAVGPGMPMVAALPWTLGVVLLLPLVPAVSARTALIAAGVLAGLALAMALWVRLDAMAPSVAVYSAIGAAH